MSADDLTLRDRYLADLRSGSTPVLVTAVAIGIAALMAASAVFETDAPGILLVVLIGVQVPLVTEDWFFSDATWRRSVAWTVVVSGGLVVVFAAGYLLGVTVPGAWELAGESSGAIAGYVAGTAVLVLTQRLL